MGLALIRTQEKEKLFDDFVFSAHRYDGQLWSNIVNTMSMPPFTAEDSWAVRLINLST